MNVSERGKKMKKSEELPKLAVVKEDILMPKSTISDIKIVDRNITLEEKKKREQLKKYAKFFYHQISDIEDFDDDKTYNAIEIANEHFMTTTDYLDKKSILTDGFNGNWQVNTLDGLIRLLENPIQLQKVDLVHAVMPFEDAVSIIYPLVRIPEVSNSRTRIALGVYGDLNNADELDYNIRVINAISDELDFSGYVEKTEDNTYMKMVYSTYQKNLRMRH